MKYRIKFIRKGPFANWYIFRNDYPNSICGFGPTIERAMYDAAKWDKIFLDKSKSL